MSLCLFVAWLLYSPKLITRSSPTGDGINAKAFLFGDEGADGYTCTSSGVNCAKWILGALAAGLSGRVGETRADEGGEDSLLDTCLVEGFWKDLCCRSCLSTSNVELKPTNLLGARLFPASLASLALLPIPLPNYPIISLHSLRSSDIPPIRLSFSSPIWRQRSSILVTSLLSILNGSNFGAGCTTGMLICFVTGFRLTSSRPLPNALFFDRCCAIGKPIWLDPNRLEGWVDHDGVRSKTKPRSCELRHRNKIRRDENGQRIKLRCIM